MDIQKILADSIRQRRNSLLKDSDWTQLADVALTTDQKTAWAQYRQQLRDLPQTLDIANINHWDDAVEKSVFPKSP
jgi:hypothetical protein